MSKLERDDSAADAPVPDAHLRAALRHAPDADAAPPASVRDAILREARSAAQARRKQRPRRLLALHPVMPWAGGFAALLVAGVVALLWGPAHDDAGAGVGRAAPDSVVSSGPEPSRDARADTAAAGKAMEQAPAAVTAAPAQAQPPRSLREPDADSRKPAPRERLPQSAPPAARRPAESEQRVAARRPEHGDARATSEEQPPPVPAAPQAPAVQAQESAPPVLPAPAIARADVDPVVPEALRRDAPAAAQSIDRFARERGAAELRRAQAPWQPALAAALPRPGSDRAGRWRWQVGTSAARPFDAAAHAWLSRLFAETAGLWRAHPGPWPDGTLLQWIEADRPLANATWHAGGVYWHDEPEGRHHFAPLTPEQRQRIGALP